MRCVVAVQCNANGIACGVKAATRGAVPRRNATQRLRNACIRHVTVTAKCVPAALHGGLVAHHTLHVPTNRPYIYTILLVFVGL